jgi:hypothetical protein
VAGNIEEFMDAMSSIGSHYRFGGGCSCGSALCDYSDCSESVKWAACRAGVTIPDGTWIQYRAIRNAGLTTTVARALKTRGALLFIFSSNPLVGGRPSQAHVAVSNGDGITTTECRGTSAGCGVFSNASKRGFNYAGLMPGFDYSALPSADQGAAGGGTPPSLEWTPPTPVGPPPSPPPPPPAPAGAVVFSAVSDNALNIIGSKECGRRKEAKIFSNPLDLGEVWLGNGILKMHLSPSDYSALYSRGYTSLVQISEEEFNDMLDITGW